MEIGNIGKVANRKRMNVEVEQLREKVSRETTKIIKLKVHYILHNLFYCVEVIFFN